MTNFRDTAAGAEFVATADSRESSPRVMAAIAFFARDISEAEALWSGDGIGRVANVLDVWENATNNGAMDDTELFWDGRTLATVLAEAA